MSRTELIANATSYRGQDPISTILGQAELERLFELLNGHPYLTRLAFYRLVAGSDMSFDRLMERAAEVDGPFGEHLRRMLLLLQDHPGLTAAIRQVVLNGTVPNEDISNRLLGAGLVYRRDGRIVPANLLYARFFKAVK